MKTILVPIDFSNAAHYSADFAIPLAQLIEAKIVFINVIEPIPDDYYNAPVSSAQMMQELEVANNKAMEKFKDTIYHRLSNSSEHFPIIESKVVFGGISAAIIEEAKELHSDYIVMGSLGSDSTIDKLIGSNCVKVAQGTHCPVWVIPKKTQISEINNLVYATDLEGDEVEVINKIVNIADLIGAKVTALHVHEEAEPEEISTRQVIEQIQAEIPKKSVIFKDLPREDVIEGLDKYIESQHPDVIVLAHEKRSWFEELFHQSVIKHLTFTAKTPLLILQKKW